MRKLCVALLVLVMAAWAANVKLYLNDGTFQLVREYKVEGDRVRFYSVERSSWEEIPASLVDLKRTEAEMNQRKAKLAEEAKVLSEEDKVERALQEEIAKIPQNPGVYYIEGGETKKIKAAESTVHTSKGRSVLKVLSPIPMVAGKGWLELQGTKSLNVFHNPQQEFYIQLSEQQRFGIVKLTAERGIRVVEKLTMIPVSKEIVEEPIEVEVFRKQLTPDGLYKIWPLSPLAPGEYAVVEYTSGKMNMQVWDFSYAPEKK
jgi:hypothetical protein